LLTLLKEQSCKTDIAADIQAVFFVYLNYKTYKTKCTTFNNILIL